MKKKLAEAQAESEQRQKIADEAEKRLKELQEAKEEAEEGKIAAE